MNNLSYYFVQNSHFLVLDSSRLREGTKARVPNPFRVPSILHNVFLDGNSIQMDRIRVLDYSNKGKEPCWHQTTQIHTPGRNQNQGCKKSPRGTDEKAFHSLVMEFHRLEECPAEVEVRKEKK